MDIMGYCGYHGTPVDTLGVLWISWYSCGYLGHTVDNMGVLWVSWYLCEYLGDTLSTLGIHGSHNSPIMPSSSTDGLPSVYHECCNTLHVQSVYCGLLFLSAVPLVTVFVFVSVFVFVFACAICLLWHALLLCRAISYCSSYSASARFEHSRLPASAQSQPRDCNHRPIAFTNLFSSNQLYPRITCFVFTNHQQQNDSRLSSCSQDQRQSPHQDREHKVRSHKVQRGFQQEVGVQCSVDP